MSPRSAILASILLSLYQSASCADDLSLGQPSSYIQQQVQQLPAVVPGQKQLNFPGSTPPPVPTLPPVVPGQQSLQFQARPSAPLRPTTTRSLQNYGGVSPQQGQSQLQQPVSSLSNSSSLGATAGTSAGTSATTGASKGVQTLGDALEKEADETFSQAQSPLQTPSASSTPLLTGAVNATGTSQTQGSQSAIGTISPTAPIGGGGIGALLGGAGGQLGQGGQAATLYNALGGAQGIQLMAPKVLNFLQNVMPSRGNTIQSPGLQQGTVRSGGFRSYMR